MENEASQTKILETETVHRACLFEVFCEGVSTQFGLRTLAKYLEKTRPMHCFGFQNLRLGGLKMKQAGLACIFDALCEGVSTGLGRRTFAKYLEQTSRMQLLPFF